KIIVRLKSLCNHLRIGTIQGVKKQRLRAANSKALKGRKRCDLVNIKRMDEFFKANDLTPTEKLVGLALGWFENYKEPGSCWPSEKAIAKATGLSVRTVKRAVASLSRKKRKIRIETLRDTKNNLHNVYHFDVTPMPANKAKPVAGDDV